MWLIINQDIVTRSFLKAASHSCKGLGSDYLLRDWDTKINYMGYSINKEFKEGNSFFLWLYKCKLYILLNWFLTKIFKKKIFLIALRLFKIKELQPWTESSFWWLRSANHVKFTEELVIHSEKHILVKINFTNGFATISLKTVHGVETLTLQ